MKTMAKDMGGGVTSLNVDGGACANNFLMQFQADILGIEVVRPKVIETTALGACYLAGLQVGYWKDIDDIKHNKKIERVFKPEMAADKRKKLLDGWDESVGRARYRKG